MLLARLHETLIIRWNAFIQTKPECPSMSRTRRRCVPYNEQVSCVVISPYHSHLPSVSRKTYRSNVRYNRPIFKRPSVRNDMMNIKVYHRLQQFDAAMNGTDWDGGRSGFSWNASPSSTIPSTPWKTRPCEKVPYPTPPSADFAGTPAPLARSILASPSEKSLAMSTTPKLFRRRHGPSAACLPYRAFLATQPVLRR